jgi:hypothetical protein
MKDLIANWRARWAASKRAEQEQIEAWRNQRWEEDRRRERENRVGAAKCLNRDVNMGVSLEDAFIFYFDTHEKIEWRARIAARKSMAHLRRQGLMTDAGFTAAAIAEPDSLPSVDRWHSAPSDE